jgi:hypothetical protein
VSLLCLRFISFIHFRVYIILTASNIPTVSDANKQNQPLKQRRGFASVDVDFTIPREQNPAKLAHDEQNPLISHFKVCVLGEYCPANINPAKAAHGEQNPLTSWSSDQGILLCAQRHGAGHGDVMTLKDGEQCSWLPIHGEHLASIVRQY